MFLRDPWYWPEIWQINPQVENPHLIFPGDILSLAYLDDGRPVVHARARPQVPKAAAASSGCRRAFARNLSRRRSRRFRTRRSQRSCRARASSRGADQRCAVHRRASRRPLRQRGPRRLRSRRRTGSARGLRLQRRASSARSSSIPTTTTCSATKASTSAKAASSAPAIPATVRMLETEREAVVGNYLMNEEDLDSAELPAAIARREMSTAASSPANRRRVVDRPVSSRRRSTAARGGARARARAAQRSRPARRFAIRNVARSARKCDCRTSRRAR